MRGLHRGHGGSRRGRGHTAFNYNHREDEQPNEVVNKRDHAVPMVSATAPSISTPHSRSWNNRRGRLSGGSERGGANLSNAEEQEVKRGGKPHHRGKRRVSDHGTGFDGGSQHSSWRQQGSSTNPYPRIRPPPTSLRHPLPSRPMEFNRASAPRPLNFQPPRTTISLQEAEEQLSPLALSLSILPSSQPTSAIGTPYIGQTSVTSFLTPTTAPSLSTTALLPSPTLTPSSLSPPDSINPLPKPSRSTPQEIQKPSHQLHVAEASSRPRSQHRSPNNVAPASVASASTGVSSLPKRLNVADGIHAHHDASGAPILKDVSRKRPNPSPAKPTVPSKKRKLELVQELASKTIPKDETIPDGEEAPQSSAGPSTPVVIHSVKAEPRSPSMSAIDIAPNRRLVTEFCSMYKLPPDCSKSHPRHIDNRQNLCKKELHALKKLGFNIVKLFFRDDGMVIEWTSKVPVWSDTLLPEKKIPEVISIDVDDDILILDGPPAKASPKTNPASDDIRKPVPSRTSMSHSTAALSSRNRHLRDGEDSDDDVIIVEKPGMPLNMVQVPLKELPPTPTSVGRVASVSRPGAPHPSVLKDSIPSSTPRGNLDLKSSDRSTNIEALPLAEKPSMLTPPPSKVSSVVAPSTESASASVTSVPPASESQHVQPRLSSRFVESPPKLPNIPVPESTLVSAPSLTPVPAASNVPLSNVNAESSSVQSPPSGDLVSLLQQYVPSLGRGLLSNLSADVEPVSDGLATRTQPISGRPSSVGPSRVAQPTVSREASMQSHETSHFAHAPSTLVSRPSHEPQQAPFTLAQAPTPATPRASGNAPSIKKPQPIFVSSIHKVPPPITSTPSQTTFPRSEAMATALFSSSPLTMLPSSRDSPNIPVSSSLYRSMGPPLPQRKRLLKSRRAILSSDDSSLPSRPSELQRPSTPPRSQYIAPEPWSSEQKPLPSRTLLEQSPLLTITIPASRNRSQPKSSSPKEGRPTDSLSTSTEVVKPSLPKRSRISSKLPAGSQPVAATAMVSELSTPSISTSSSNGWEDEELAKDFLSKFMSAFIADRPSLIHAYSSDAVLSCRVFPSPLALPHRADLGTFYIRDYSLSQTASHPLFVTELLSRLGPYTLSQSVKYDMVVLHESVGGGILLTASCNTIRPFSASLFSPRTSQEAPDGSESPQADGVPFYMMHSFVLKRAEKGVNTTDSESWPLVVSAHQLVIRYITDD